VRKTTKYLTKNGRYAGRYSKRVSPEYKVATLVLYLLMCVKAWVYLMLCGYVELSTVVTIIKVKVR
jgi:hypothetical protein